jgi:hypothetical protein
MVEQKLTGLRAVMDWVSSGRFIVYDRIEIDDEGEVTILPIPPAPEAENQFLQSRADDIKTSPYHKLPARRREND